MLREHQQMLEACRIHHSSSRSSGRLMVQSASQPMAAVANIQAHRQQRLGQCTCWQGLQLQESCGLLPAGACGVCGALVVVDASVFGSGAIQVSTRLLSACAPLYWFAALLMLHKGPVLRWLLWCTAAPMWIGVVFFVNFYPWV